MERLEAGALRRSSVAGPIDTLRGVARLYVDPPAHTTELYSSRQPRPARDAAAGDVVHCVDDSTRSFADGRYERDQRIINRLFGLWTMFTFVAIAVAIAIAWHVDLLDPSSPEDEFAARAWRTAADGCATQLKSDRSNLSALL
jgi:hypothetical protein